MDAHKLLKRLKDRVPLIFITRADSALIFSIILLIPVLVTVVLQPGAERPFSDIPIFFGFCLLFLVHVFMLNSYADYEADIMVGKSPRRVDKGTYLYGSLLFGSASAIVSSYIFDSSAFLVLLLMYAIGISYSLRPIRLKERGPIALLASPLCLGVLEYLAFFSGPVTGVKLPLSIWLFSFILILELGQQIRDFKNDVRTQTNTFVTGLGVESSKILFGFLSVAYLFYCAALSFLNPAFTILWSVLIPITGVPRYFVEVMRFQPSRRPAL